MPSNDAFALQSELAGIRKLNGQVNPRVSVKDETCERRLIEWRM